MKVALQELSKKEMAALLAGATAARAIMDRVAQDDPDELPMDEIRQWEISALYHLEVAKDAMALGFKRRLEAGASVEPGPYTLDPDTDTMEDLEDHQREYSGGEFNCVGFNGVGWDDPTKAAPVTEAKAAKNSTKRGARKLAKREGKR